MLVAHCFPHYNRILLDVISGITQKNGKRRKWSAGLRWKSTSRHQNQGYLPWFLKPTLQCSSGLFYIKFRLWIIAKIVLLFSTKLLFSDIQSFGSGFIECGSSYFFESGSGFMMLLTFRLCKHEIFSFFIFWWTILSCLDHPDSQSGSGSADQLESYSNPDPKYCWFQIIYGFEHHTTHGHLRSLCRPIMNH